MNFVYNVVKSHVTKSTYSTYNFVFRDIALQFITLITNHTSKRFRHGVKKLAYVLADKYFFFAADTDLNLK